MKKQHVMNVVSGIKGILSSTALLKSKKVDSCRFQIIINHPCDLNALRHALSKRIVIQCTQNWQMDGLFDGKYIIQN